MADILDPIAGGPHAAFAAEIARAIAATNDSRVTLVNVVDPGASEDERETARERLAEAAAVFGDDEHVEQSIVEGSDVVGTIVELSEGCDLTLIGATRASVFQQLLFGAIPEQVGQRAENTVIMAKRNIGIGSRLGHWFKRRNHR